ncbi:ATP-binding cassette domain-containing protein [Pleurocapsales cyanobacterium LEGE 10410]|nr:ATP-binding cassette domain-containing protein [Pleurocapsales cyanobacterium LEGE 10410]
MSDRPTNSILRLEQVGLQATIGSDFLLKDISFSVETGKKVAVIGASGAGKTSLLRLLNRLSSPSQGTIYLQNVPSQQLSAVKLRRQIVLATQEPKLLGMNAREALSYPLQLQRLSESEIRARIDTWTTLLHIPDSWLNKTELQLSLGQRQLVAIARALVMQPQVLLLDEPTSALDIGTATHLLRVLDELNRSQSLTIVMVNHQLELVKNFCDRLLFLNEGRLAADFQAGEVDWQSLQQKLLHRQTQQQQDWL